jgi:hypothetical protein
MATYNKYAYTKKHHFAHLLNNLQGVSSSNIPDNLLEAVKEDIVKNENVVNPSSVRASLRRLGEAKYYEDKYFIAEMLGWETPMRELNMSNLLSDFTKFNNAYSKIKSDRTSSFPFSFIIYKMVEQQLDLPPQRKEVILVVLFEDLPLIYKEWINPELLLKYDTFDTVLRQAQIVELQDIWDKTMEQIESDD